MFIKKDKRQNNVSMSYDERYLRSEISQTKWALDRAYSNFENVVEPALIDSYIYELNAIQARYNYLLKKARDLEKKENN